MVFASAECKRYYVRQLMNHTSGLIRYEFKDQFTKDLTANPDKVWKPEELLSYLFDEKAPFEAGKSWDYSDTNYIVLGMIIEKVTGKKYYDGSDKASFETFEIEKHETAGQARNQRFDSRLRGRRKSVRRKRCGVGKRQIYHQSAV